MSATTTTGGAPAATERTHKEAALLLAGIRKVIPKDCLEPKAALSLWFVAKDLSLIAMLASALYLVRGTTWYAGSPAVATLAVSAIYCFLQGTMFWAVFVLGHDCGHGSFSRSRLLNAVCGQLLHAMILVPYESWRLSHRQHHKNTGHIDKDEVFTPQRVSTYDESVRRAPLLLGFAWFYYLVVGQTPRNRPHFSPWSSVYGRDEAPQVALSVALCGLVALGVARCIVTFGFWVVCTYYLVPLLVFGSWLVVTTFLHHQDEGIVWLSGEKWSFTAGSLATVDRSYWPFDSTVHHIGTHQIHHLFSTIPHYHLERATEAFRRHFGHLPGIVHDQTKSRESILSAFARLAWMYRWQPALADTQTHWVFS